MPADADIQAEAIAWARKLLAQQDEHAPSYVPTPLEHIHSEVARVHFMPEISAFLEACEQQKMANREIQTFLTVADKALDLLSTALPFGGGTVASLVQSATPAGKRCAFSDIIGTVLTNLVGPR